MPRRHAFAALVVALLPTLAWAAPIPPDAQEKEGGSADKVRGQLEQPITLEISDLSLNAALNKIRDQAKINFVVDKFGIQQLGLDPEQMPVSVKLKDAKARTCLRSILAPYNLGYAIIGDTVLISTDDLAMHRQLKQRVSVDVEKVDLAVALKQLSKDTATNVVLDSRVPAKEAKTAVSLQMDDVPLETAVRLLAETAGLKPVKVGNVFLVTTKARAAELRSDPDLNGAPNPNSQPNQRTDLQQLLQVQNAAIWLNGANGIGMNVNANGMIIGGQQPGNTPIPPLEKPTEKSDDQPAEPEKKPAPPSESR